MNRLLPPVTAEVAWASGGGERLEGRDVTDKEHLPIACTLAPVDFEERLSSIAALARSSLRSCERNDLQLVLVYAPEVAADVHALVAAEQQCCAFLHFDVRHESDGLRVTITAPEHALDAVDELFAQFLGRSTPAK